MSDAPAPNTKRTAKPAGRRPQQRPPNVSAPRRPREPAGPGITALKEFLAGLDLGVSPSLHVNGSAYVTAFLAVDLGVPLNAKRLAPEQEHELADHIRAATRDVMKGREARVAVYRDQSNGIWWSAIS